MTETDDILEAVATLRRGGIILYPTDTIWGLGCDACCPEAVNRLFELKRRPEAKAMLLLAADRDMAARYVGDVPETAWEAVRDAVRPTTMIYPGAKGVCEALIADDGSIGIRIPDYEFCRRLCRELGRPIVSTSANLSGQPAAATFAEIDPAIMAQADYVALTGRDRPAGLPSDIVRTMPDNTLFYIRSIK